MATNCIFNWVVWRLAGCAAVGGGLIAAAADTFEVSVGPLKGLPSPVGPHAQRIAALGDKSWLALGRPAADPKWGAAPGRSWCCTMPFAPEVRGAFLYGEGVHGHVKPDGRYMDDCWLYDLNAHRWICVYPGTDPKNPGLTLSADGFPIDDAGQLTPVSLCVHAYDLLTYDSDRRRLMIMGVHEQHFAPKTLKALRPASGKLPPSSPWMYDLAAGAWRVQKIDGPAPEKAEGTLLYLPGHKKAFYRSGNSDFIWYFDPAAATWTRVSPKGPKPPFRIDPTACYDPKRDRIYIGGGSYPSVEEGKNALWIYDLKSDAWIDPQPKNTPLSRYATNYASMRYDPVADVVLVAGHATQKRGIFVYDPKTNAWDADPLPFPDDFPTKQCVNGFYDPEWNVHVFHVAGDSRPEGQIWAYRYKRAAEK